LRERVIPPQLTQSFVQLDNDNAPVVERGRQAWKSLRSDETFEKWVAIGRAIGIGRNETMRAVHQPADRRAVEQRFRLVAQRERL
jgi:hypothetical protein